MNGAILWISPLRGASPERWKTGTGHRPVLRQPVVVTGALAQLSSPLARPQNGPDARGAAWDSGQGANLSGKGRPTAPAPRWWGDRRRPAPTSNTSGSPQRQRGQERPRLRDLVADRAALHRHRRTGRGDTSGIDQPSRRSSGATARDVTTSNVAVPCRSSARPRTTVDVAEPQLGHDLVEERRTPQQRLDQGHREVRSSDRQHQARADRRRCRCRRPRRPPGRPRPARPS